ncbi:MAG TPA: C45 family peptidase [Nitrososphaerales archaeon]|nr:C45 family peptidase [Nitrososphaerales archaeon]
MLEQAQKTYPVVELTGKPYDIGFKHGSELKPMVVGNIKKVFALMRKYAPSNDRATILKAAKKFVAPTEKWSPDTVEEIHGIADGAGVKFEEAFALNCLTELSLNVSDFGSSFGCTCFCAQTPTTNEGELFIGQNQDLWAPWCRDYFAILKISPSKGPKIAITTLAGMVGMVGLNSDGLAVVGNGLSIKGNQIGVPIMLFMRRVLEQRTIGNVVGLLTMSKRASPLNLLVGDANGEFYDFELAAKDYESFYIGEGSYAHSNNCWSPKLKERETVQDGIFYPDTVVRVNRMRKLLHANEGRVGIEEAKAFLSDHVNYPRSICRHPDPSIPESEWQDQWETTASVIMEPRKSRLWIAAGNPCVEQYVQYN